jgi:hypothetical protein
MRPAVATIALVAAGALAGCGDDEGTTTTSTTTTSTTTATITETAADPHGTGLPEERCREAESPPNIVDVISYGADCGAVEDAMSELRSVSKSFRIGDFECSRTSGTRLGGTWECLGEASYFTFEFGD